MGDIQGQMHVCTTNHEIVGGDLMYLNLVSYTHHPPLYVHEDACVSRIRSGLLEARSKIKHYRTPPSEVENALEEVAKYFEERIHNPMPHSRRFIKACDKYALVPTHPRVEACSTCNLSRACQTQKVGRAC